MARPAVLSVRIIGDAQSSVKALGDTETAAQKMQVGLDKASVASAAALAGLAAAAVTVGKAASEAEQAAGAVDSVFGDYAQSVHDYAANAADAVGLAEDQYGSLASIIGSQLKNMGVSMDDLSGQTDELIGMGADLAATFGGSTSDAVSALSSLLRGERDPIEKYGVAIKQADIDAKLAAMGLADLEGEAAKAATTQATLALLTEQTAAAQGQFGREANTAAGQQERANAQWRNAQIALGEQLLPVMTEGARIASELAQWMGENTEVVTALAAAIAILAGGVLVINGAMKAYAAIQALQTAAQWANNAAWLASPVTWIVLAVVAAIALVVAAVVLVVKHWDTIKAKAAEVWGAVIDWIMSVVEWLNLDDAWEALVAGFNWIKDTAATVWESIIGGIQTMIGWIQSAIGWFTSLFGAQDTASANQADLDTASMAARAPVEMLHRMAPASMSLSREVTPELAARTAMVPSLVPSGGFSSAARPVVNEYNITITGAIDPEGTARTIDRVMTRHRRRNGQLAAAGETWQ